MAIVIKRALCLELPTAGLVIGFIGAFFGILQLFELIFSFFNLNDLYDQHSKKSQPDSEYKSIFMQVAPYVLSVMLVLFLLDFIATILLIVGIKKKSERMLLPWLFIKGTALAISIPITSLGFFTGIVAICIGHGIMLLMRSFLTLILLGLCSYIFMVIYSLYYFIRDEVRNPLQFDSEGQQYPNIQYNKT